MVRRFVEYYISTSPPALQENLIPVTQCQADVNGKTVVILRKVHISTGRSRPSKIKYSHIYINIYIHACKCDAVHKNWM